MTGANNFRLLVDDIGERRAAEILRVDTRTVRKWSNIDRKPFGNPPAAAVLALYWESRYGMAQWDADNLNIHRMVCAELDTCRVRIAALEAALAATEAARSDGAANAPYFTSGRTNEPQTAPRLTLSTDARHRTSQR
jgi:hypothetical protein